MNINPLVSIIVAAYNEEKNIEKCIESLIKQTYNNIEIIVINDGSEDGTKELVEKICEKDDRILLLTQQNQGVSVARNLGIKVCKGEWVMFADADDEYDINAIKLCLKVVENTGLQLIQAGLNRGNQSVENENTYVLESKAIMKVLFNYNADVSEYKKVEEIIDKHLRYSIHGPYGKLINKNLIKKIRFNANLKLGEDLIFYFELLKQVEYVAFMSRDIYSVNSNNFSTTRRFNPDMPKAVETYIDYMSVFVEDNNDFTNIKKDIYISFYYHYKVAVEAFYSNKDNIKKRKIRALELRNFVEKNIYLKRAFEYVLKEKSLSWYEKLLVRMLKNNKEYMYLLIMESRKAMSN